MLFSTYSNILNYIIKSKYELNPSKTEVILTGKMDIKKVLDLLDFGILKIMTRSYKETWKCWRG